jgi:carbohydrate diacid regulator
LQDIGNKICESCIDNNVQGNKFSTLPKEQQKRSNRKGVPRMISNQILQNTIDGLKGITRIDLCIIDTEGKVLAATFQDTDNYVTAALAFVESPADSQVFLGCQFFKVFDEHQLEYILLANGDSDDVFMVGKIASFQLQNLLVAYKERFDKDNFVKNLLLDNLLLVDIYNRAKKLHIDTEARRVVFIVETNREKDGNELEKVRGLLGSKSRDFITAVDEKNIIVVKEVLENEGYADLNKTAEVILNLFHINEEQEIHIAYGTIVNEIKEVSRSYKEARMALDVGKIFFEERNVIAYSTLGIGRLIYQLPIPLCKMFIKEIFDGKSPDEFDEETLTTINKFFENSLNVSETSRQLYIHRNTLVYRLDKLQKSTGLDLRVFEDAITFKIALMVVKYMKYMESLDY